MSDSLEVSYNDLSQSIPSNINVWADWLLTESKRTEPYVMCLEDLNKKFTLWYNDILTCSINSRDELSSYVENQSPKWSTNFAYEKDLQWQKYSISFEWGDDFSKLWRKNVAFLRNNPGSLKAWKSYQKFEDIQSWIQALVEKIKRNFANWVTINVKSPYNWNMTVEEYFKIYSSAETYLEYSEQVLKRLWWLKKGTKLKDINPIDFACCIMKKENWACYNELIKKWIINFMP